jgi:hypothetical protein
VNEKNIVALISGQPSYIFIFMYVNACLLGISNESKTVGFMAVMSGYHKDVNSECKTAPGDNCS